MGGVVVPGLPPTMHKVPDFSDLAPSVGTAAASLANDVFAGFGMHANKERIQNDLTGMGLSQADAQSEAAKLADAIDEHHIGQICSVVSDVFQEAGVSLSSSVAHANQFAELLGGGASGGVGLAGGASAGGNAGSGSGS